MKDNQKYDVLVTGGGVAGIAAAIAAGRTGAKTALLEGSQTLGGTAAMGLNCSFEGVNVELMGGINREIIYRLKKRNAIIVGSYAPFSIVDFQDVCMELMCEANVDIYFGCTAQYVKMNGKYISDIGYRYKSQTFEMSAKAYVDGTGDGEICYMAGAEMELGDPETREIQPVSILFRMGNVNVDEVIQYVEATRNQFYDEKFLFECDLGQYPPLLIANGFFEWVSQQKKKGLYIDREAFAIINTPNPGEVLINGTRLNGINAMNVLEASKAILELRKQAKSLSEALIDSMPGFKDSYVIDMSPSLGVRETRRVKGVYQLSIEDIEKGKDFEDSITYNYFPSDIHGPQSNPLGYSWILPGGNGIYGIPLRCLVPQNIYGLFVAGRCISSSHKAHGSTRTMPCCIATGQAAGIAAALYKKEMEFEQFVSIVKHELKKQDVMLK